MKNLFLIFILLFSTSIWSQEAVSEKSDDEIEIPTQTDLMLKGLPAAIFNIPNYFMTEFFMDHGLDQYGVYSRVHKKDPQSSPFRVFLGGQSKRVPNDDDHFPFVNSAFDFMDIVQLEYGVCSAVTFGLRRFHMLANFDPENSFKEDVPEYEFEFEKWISFYKKKIDSIFQLRPVNIPYFRNVNEFASHRDLQDYIKKHIVSLWIKKNVSLQGLIQYQGVKEKPDIHKAYRLYLDVLHRLRRGYNPIVYMAQPSGGSKKAKGKNKNPQPVDFNFQGGDDDTTSKGDYWIHVVQVYKLSKPRPDGSFSFWVWDINEDYAEFAKKEVKMKPDGTFVWPDTFEGVDKDLSAVHLYPQDDVEVATIVANKLAWCGANDQRAQVCGLKSEFPLEILNQ
ncbi:MAG: hypothetical protein H6621_00670 [Halobacteriovoraceae bacterium]|nr:hypothetical protein [Halobacteriovoraceae bacterium]MCB9093553.1 hypothetical protein [Halobacteriovoraceae bacterium]